MTDANKAKDFNKNLELRLNYNEKTSELIEKTKYNKIWQNTLSEEHFPACFNEIIAAIDNCCFPLSYEKIEERVFNKYYDKLISHLEKKTDCWNLLQQIRDRVLPIVKWPHYNDYIETLNKAKAKFDASPEAIKLKQLQEEWRKHINSSSGNFKEIDWTSETNRAQFCDWLNYCIDKKDAKWLLNQMDYSKCFEYADFCLSAPFWIIYDDNGLLTGEGLLSNIKFLLDNIDTLGACAIYYKISDNLSDAISTYPEEMLALISEEGYNFPNEFLKAIADSNIPDSFTKRYKEIETELKSYC